MPGRGIRCCLSSLRGHMARVAKVAGLVCHYGTSVPSRSSSVAMVIPY